MTYVAVEKLLLDEKVPEVEEAANVARTQLGASYEHYATRLAKRSEEVRSELFGGIEDTAALARAATATEDEIREMMELSSFTSNKELGKVAFTVAVRKGYGDLVGTYLNDVDDGDAREIYEEWTQIPT